MRKTIIITKDYDLSHNDKNNNETVSSVSIVNLDGCYLFCLNACLNNLEICRIYLGAVCFVSFGSNLT